VCVQVCIYVSIFEPTAGTILKDRDELRVVLKLSELPTPKAFRDAVASLSPEQQDFAATFRGLQGCGLALTRN
jgi:hypothetical protein